MPTYVYQREDGTTFEIEQRITAEPLTHCPTTGQPVRRVISGGTGLIFKGSGFYLTDYVRGNGKSKASPPERSSSTAESSDDSSSSSATKTDSATDTKKSD